ncbi:MULTISPECIES: GTP cyclohydrolase II [unclassified Nocardia]|uniref:GTP cyclohydrolase II n=1 Tax=unclassified Nocardia TaxID=2637762 RepID=UPI0024A81B7F|nr:MULTISPECIES: GTP cyclohydrolase II [unclassified Nocardia]
MESSTRVGAGVRTRVRIPLTFADGYATAAEAVTFDGLSDGREHLALVLGEPDPRRVPLVRLHSECLTGDVFGSARCDCGPQLREAVERITDTGGVLLYLRQEGRDIGLYNKLDAYALQDSGLDTYQANTALGLPEDARDYTAAAQMLTALGISELDLLTNNPDKARQLDALGVGVRRTVRTGVHATPSNLRYLRAKADHTGHTIQIA